MLAKAAAAAAIALLAAGCGVAPTATPGALAITGATVIASPEAPAIADGVVIVRGGRIASAGRRGEVPIPPDAQTLDARGGFLVAGFQNSHVHFTQPRWEGAGAAPAAHLAEGLREIALRWGFTTVFDVGSDLDNTLKLRGRIARGEIPGPRILTTGVPFYPVDGIPWYLREALPPGVLARLNTPKTPEEGARIAARQIEAGADAVKLFIGSGMGAGRVKLMDGDIARAIAAEAHRRGRLAFTHASNLAGTEIALAAGVDVVTHATDDRTGLGPGHLRRMVAARMAMMPTLKLFGERRDIAELVRHVGDFAAAGGTILFGTDVGFIEDMDPTREYALLADAGLGWRQVLAALTTAPAARFGESGRRGRIAPGMEADLVLLGADPARDPLAFARVRLVLRAGKVVYERTE